jgi:hypothetical protein
MNSRRQFILEGLKQAGLMFGVLLLFTLPTLLFGRTLVFWLVRGGGYSIFKPIWFISHLTVIVAASILIGPVPTLLTLFDISNKQLFILSCVLIIPYWLCLGIIAGLIQRSNIHREADQQRNFSVKQITKRIRWTIGIVLFVIAAIFFLNGPIAGPNYISNGRYSVGATRLAVINEVRQVDGAKNEFILEKSPPTNYVLTETDLMPYIKLNSKGKIPHARPERYVLNPLNQPVYAVLDSDWRIRRHGWHEGFTFTNGTVFQAP